MKNIIIIALTLLSFSAKAQEIDISNLKNFLTETKSLVRAGDYKKALDRHIWYHDHVLDHDRSLSSVRLSFALNDWKKLADKYPPAMDSLKNIRDKNTQKALLNGTLNAFQDVVALNRILNDSGKTAELFSTITYTHPANAKTLFIYAKHSLFEAHRYNIISKYLGDPLTEFQSVQKMHNTAPILRTEVLSKLSAPEKVRADSLLKKAREKFFVDQSVQLIKYAAAVNDLNSAKQIQQKALDIVNDPRLEQALKK